MTALDTIWDSQLNSLVHRLQIVRSHSERLKADQMMSKAIHDGLRI